MAMLHYSAVGVVLLLFSFCQFTPLRIGYLRLRLLLFIGETLFADKETEVLVGRNYER